MDQEFSQLLNSVLAPGCVFIGLIKADGTVLATKSSISDSDSVLQHVANTERAVLQFASSLDRSTCTCIHVKGSVTLLSLFDVNALAILAVISTCTSSTIESIDTQLIESRISPLLQELAAKILVA